MIVAVVANPKQIDDVDITITMTMKLREWKLVSDALRKDGATDYHWSKTSVAHAIEETFEKYHTQVLEDYKQ
jgi:hypothetical protein